MSQINTAPAVETTTAPAVKLRTNAALSEKEVAKRFGVSLNRAVKTQADANKNWHDAQVLATEAAILHRNMDLFTQLYKAAFDSKAVRARDLLSFVLMLGGDETSKESAATWDSKKLTFGLKAKRSLIKGARELSKSTAWFEWAKPERQTVPSFDSLLAAIRKAIRQVDKGELSATKEQKLALAGIKDAVVKNLGSEILESGRAAK